MLEKHPEVAMLRVCGTTIEDIDFPGLGDIIPMLAKRKVSYENDENIKNIPQDLKKHCLYFKIRDDLSKEAEIKNFIRYEKKLSHNEELKVSEDYKLLKKVKDEYIALKKKAESVVLKKAQVIFCTCAEAGSNRMKARELKQCIIDECGMCTEPETLLPMILSKKIILVGDHKQLQPVVLSKTAKSLGLKISMFERLYEDEKMSHYCIMLTEQYRMVNITVAINFYVLYVRICQHMQHPSICDFPSRQFYDGNLVAANEVSERRWSGKLPSHIWKRQKTHRCVFIHVEGTEDTSGIDAKGSYTESRSNQKEAQKVVSESY